MSVIISLSLVLFVVGLLSLVLINAQKLSNYVKENIGFSIMIKEDIKEIELIEFNKILDAEDFTKSTRFISKEQATKKTIITNTGKNLFIIKVLLWMELEWTVFFLFVLLCQKPWQMI